MEAATLTLERMYGVEESREVVVWFDLFKARARLRYVEFHVHPDHRRHRQRDDGDVAVARPCDVASRVVRVRAVCLLVGGWSFLSCQIS